MSDRFVVARLVAYRQWVQLVEMLAENGQFDEAIRLLNTEQNTRGRISEALDEVITYGRAVRRPGL